LAKILSSGFQRANLDRDLTGSRTALRYRTLSRLKTPALILYAQDGASRQRGDALYLQATLTTAESAVKERGGPWTAWIHRSAFENRLISFKRKSERRDRKPPRKRSGTLNGQPLGWMVMVFALTAAGLTVGSDLFRLQPGYMSRVIPPIYAGLFPILWFIIPKRMTPIAFLRFRRFSLRSVLLPLGIGALLGAFYRSLLLTMANVSFPAVIPESLLSLAPGDPGRLLELAGLAVSSLFVFGVAANLWVLRRSSLQILLPAVLFALLPPALPDLLWKLPGGFAAAILFAANVSICAPMFLIIGFAATSEFQIPLQRVPISWQSAEGVAVTVALLAGAILITVLIGARDKPIPPEDLYFAGSLNRGDNSLRWGTNLGTVVVIFSLIAAAASLFGFIAV
jgi:hypothetical protein